MAKTEYRVMEEGKAYLIQERDNENTEWVTVGEFDNINDARSMVRDLRSQR
jgi:hypothetical protein